MTRVAASTRRRDARRDGARFAQQPAEPQRPRSRTPWCVASSTRRAAVCATPTSRVFFEYAGSGTAFRSAPRFRSCSSPSPSHCRRAERPPPAHRHTRTLPVGRAVTGSSFRLAASAPRRTPRRAVWRRDAPPPPFLRAVRRAPRPVRAPRASPRRAGSRDGTEDEEPFARDRGARDAMDTASKLRNRDAGGKVTTVGRRLVVGRARRRRGQRQATKSRSSRPSARVATRSWRRSWGSGGGAGPTVRPQNVTSRPSSKGSSATHVTARLETESFFGASAGGAKLKACDDVKWYL